MDHNSQMSASPIQNTNHFDILATPYGGRGAFPSSALSNNTLVLACDGPYASVILRKFRKEVCAWCFAYAYESGKNTWNIRIHGAGVWFCSNECREKLAADEDGSGLRSALNVAVEKVTGRKKQQNGNQKQNKADPSLSLKFLDTINPDEVVLELLERTWRLSEEVDVTSISAINLDLNEFELDSARFVLDGLCRRCLEQLLLSSNSQRNEEAIIEGIPNSPTSAGSWSDLLRLQDNELQNTQAKPYILASHIRVYWFLRLVISVARQAISNQSANLAGPLKLLSSYTDVSDSIRSILGRDHGNVFGLWEKGAEGQDSEMLGWGMYVFGSYFNHDCTPNLVKSRSGRALQFTTTNSVPSGKELCISYVDVAEGTSAKERRDELEKEWFFICGCARCQREMTVAEGRDKRGYT